MSASPEVSERGLEQIFEGEELPISGKKASERKWPNNFKVWARHTIGKLCPGACPCGLQWVIWRLSFHLLDQHLYQGPTTFKLSMIRFVSPMHDSRWSNCQIGSQNGAFNNNCMKKYHHLSILGINEACFPAKIALWVTYASTPACLIVVRHWFVYS